MRNSYIPTLSTGWCRMASGAKPRAARRSGGAEVDGPPWLHASCDLRSHHAIFFLSNLRTWYQRFPHLLDLKNCGFDTCEEGGRASFFWPPTFRNNRRQSRTFPFGIVATLSWVQISPRAIFFFLLRLLITAHFLTRFFQHHETSVWGSIPSDRSIREYKSCHAFFCFGVRFWRVTGRPHFFSMVRCLIAEGWKGEKMHEVMCAPNSESYVMVFFPNIIPFSSFSPLCVSGWL